MGETSVLTMDEIMARFSEIYVSVKGWAEVNLLTYESVMQIGVIVTLYLLCSFICSRLKPFMHKVLKKKAFYQKTELYLKALYLPVLWWLTTFSAWQITESLGYPIILLRMASTLIAVWLIISIYL